MFFESFVIIIGGFANWFIRLNGDGGRPRDSQSTELIVYLSRRIRADRKYPSILESKTERWQAWYSLYRGKPRRVPIKFAADNCRLDFAWMASISWFISARRCFRQKRAPCFLLYDRVPINRTPFSKYLLNFPSLWIVTFSFLRETCSKRQKFFNYSA